MSIVERDLTAAIEKLRNFVPPDDVGIELQLVELIEKAADILQQYDYAVRFPGADQRHVGTSVATQLVHAQMMRKKSEVELAAVKKAARELLEVLDIYAVFSFGETEDNLRDLVK